ncbi:MAG: hypothetical protein HOE90_05890 [Bacteriovoracaceae bacterium]|nr:hypothetical protein [Bacteriovoracaceae bacterium]
MKATVALAVFLLFGLQSAFASFGYFKAFDAQYPNNSLKRCDTCHIVPGPGVDNLTLYGKSMWEFRDLATAKEMLEAIELVDSDEDGFLNKAEIEAETNPSDKADFPAEQ